MSENVSSSDRASVSLVPTSHLVCWRAAYDVSARGELVAWLNELLAPQQITKLEQCGTGSIYCQVSKNSPL